MNKNTYIPVRQGNETVCCETKPTLPYLKGCQPYCSTTRQKLSRFWEALPVMASMIYNIRSKAGKRIALRLHTENTGNRRCYVSVLNF